MTTGTDTRADLLLPTRSLPVERPVTIAVTGTHLTGKSTLLARMAHEMRRHDLEVATISDLGEQALRLGLPCRHSNTYASTLWLMTRAISAEIETWPHVDVVLVNRPVTAALGLYLAALDYRDEPPCPTPLGHLRAIAAHHAAHYDLVYRTKIESDDLPGTISQTPGLRRYLRLADQHIARVLADLLVTHQVLAIADHDAAVAHATEFALTHAAP